MLPKNIAAAYICHVDVDDMSAPLDPPDEVEYRKDEGFVPLLWCAKDKRGAGTSAYRNELGITALQNMPVGIVCHCKCSPDVRLCRSELQHCDFCLWYYHTKCQDPEEYGGKQNRTVGMVCAKCNAWKESKKMIEAPSSKRKTCSQEQESTNKKSRQKEVSMSISVQGEYVVD